MYTTILLAAALQDWERYSTHALAVREVAATLARACRAAGLDQMTQYTCGKKFLPTPKN
jgi:hypothetical protein